MSPSGGMTSADFLNLTYMKNNLLNYLSIGAALFGMTMTSCSNDLWDDENYTTVRVSTNITVPEADATRTTLNENQGNLEWKWEKGDKVAVIDESGANVGYMKAGEPYNNGKTAPFEGFVKFKEGKSTENIRIYYPGKGHEPEEINSKLTIDLSTQDGQFSSIVKRDILESSEQLPVEINQNYTIIPDFTMNHLTAAGRFKLIYKSTNQPAANVQDVKISGLTNENGNAIGYVNTTKSIDFTKNNATSRGHGTITAPTDANGEMYLNFLPANPAGMKFEVTANGKSYVGYLGSATKTFPLNAGTYLRSGKTLEGLEIYLEAEGGTVDHSKNPLNKWAEGDLVYNKSTKKSTVATSYTTQGSLYQWGRNIGYTDYKDAMGGTEEVLFWKYATYGRYYKTGTGIYGGNDHQSGYSYKTASDLKECEDLGMYAMVAPTSPSSTDPLKYDYWVSSFGNGGSTWQERANAIGIDMSLVPSGYRMPTEADFLEIKPSSPLSGSGSLSSVINNRVELREIEGVCKYAIRWTVETVGSKRYMRIDALVVPNSFSESQLSSINWTSNTDVVTRRFGAQGAIHAFYHQNIVSGQPAFNVARPMPYMETHIDKLWVSGNYWTVLWNYVTDYAVNNVGLYWMADQKKAFYFEDNTNTKNASVTNTETGVTTYPFTSRLSVFGTIPVSPQDCCAVRLIDTSKE